MCGDGKHDTGLLIDELHAQSMLRLRDLPGGPARITLAEPVREFAAGRLTAARARRLRGRHRAWWPRWAAGFGPTPPLALVRRDLPNILGALASAVADGAPEDAVHVALALRAAFTEIALPAGGIKHLAAALEAVTDNDTALKSRGHSLPGLLCLEAGAGAQAQQHTERGLALAGDDPALRARALHAAASVRWRATRDTTGLAVRLDEAAALAERAGDPVVRASVDALRAFIANVAERDYVLGEALHRRALALWQQLGNQHVINGGIYNLAICAFNGQRWAEALERVGGVIATARDHDDWEQLSDALNLQGNTLAALRDWPAARAAYRAHRLPRVRARGLGHDGNARPGLRPVEPAHRAGPPAPARGRRAADELCRALLAAPLRSAGPQRPSAPAPRAAAGGGAAKRGASRRAVGRGRGDAAGAGLGAGARGHKPPDAAATAPRVTGVYEWHAAPALSPVDGAWPARPRPPSPGPSAPS